jgi:chromosome segregation ATPase
MGVLSQSLTNFQNIQQTITPLTESSLDAGTLRDEVLQTVTSLIPQIQSLQAAYTSYVSPLNEVLDQAILLAQSSDPASEVLPTVQGAALIAAQLQTTLTNIQSGIASQQPTIEDLGTAPNYLNGQVSQLNGQIQQLQSQEQPLQQALNELGSLGVDGILEKELASLTQQSNALTARVDSLNTLLAACTELPADFQDLMNAIAAMGDSVTSLIADLASAEKEPKAELLWLTAAQNEMKIFAADA